jgi:hypothetical protein
MPKSRRKSRARKRAQASASTPLHVLRRGSGSGIYQDQLPGHGRTRAQQRRAAIEENRHSTEG